VKLRFRSVRCKAGDGNCQNKSNPITLEEIHRTVARIQEEEWRWDGQGKGMGKEYGRQVGRR